jgi:hypothetical protein
MCFPRNWEFGSAFSKLRSSGWGLNPPNHPRYATDVAEGKVKLRLVRTSVFSRPPENLTKNTKIMTAEGS